MQSLAPALLLLYFNWHQPGAADAVVEKLDIATRGFHLGFASTDGKHGYLVPYIDLDGGKPCGSRDDYCRDGRVTRFSCEDFTKPPETLNLEAWGYKGYIGGFEHGGYGYVMSHFDDTRHTGIVLRFNTTTFDSVDALDMSTTNAGLKGFFGAFTDGTYGYTTSWSHPDGHIGRFSLQDFSTVEYLNAKSVDGNLGRLMAGLFDGTYGYVIAADPYSNGRIARFNVSNFDAASIQVLDLTTKQANLQGYRHMFSDGTYGYCVPWMDGASQQHGRTVRFRLGQPTFGDTVEILDVAQADSALVGFLMGGASDAYGYMFPHSHGKIAVFHLENFDQPFAVDLTQTNGALRQWYGGFVIGDYAYTIPYIHKMVGRISVTTTTSTTTSTASSTSTSTRSSSTTTTSTETSTSTTTSTETSTSSTSTSSISSTSSSSTTSSSTSTSTSTSSSSSTSSTSSTTTSSTTSTSTTSTSSTNSISSTSSSTSSSTATTTSSTTSTSTTTTTTSSSSSTRSSTTTITSSSTTISTTTTSVSSSTTTITSTTGTTTGTSSSTSKSTTTVTATSAITRTPTATMTEDEVTTTATTLGALGKSLAVQAAVANSVAALLAGNGTSLKLVTEMGIVTVVDLNAALAGGERATISSDGGSKVSMTKEVLQSVPKNAILAILDINDEGNSTSDDDPFASLGDLASKTLDVSVHDSSGQKAEVSFASPLLFKLPGSDGVIANGQTASCVYLEADGAGGAKWSTRGVRKATDAEVLAAGEMLGGVWCLTEHLSIFSSLLEVVLGCTNLELLSSEALKAVLAHERWYAAESAIIVFFIWSLLVLAVVVGNLRECHALRLGRTHDTGKAVNLCRSFMMWGPQVLKHRYAIFVVYAKDIFQCMTTHRAKLKTSILTASVQRFLAVRTGISVACVTQHCWKGGAWVSSNASLPYTVLARKLEFHAGAAERVIMEDICMRGPCGVLRRFALTVWAIHPLLDSMRVGAGSMTVGKRTMLQVASICGVIATNALIFNFSGDFRSWEAEAECPIDPRSHFFIIVATLVSLMVNAVPNAFLMDLAKQVHGRPIWNCAFWLLTLAYMSCAVLFIIVALSNLNRRDQEKWYASLEWGMSIKLIGMPVAQGIRNLVLLEVFLRHDRQCKPSERFRVVMGLSHPNEMILTKEAQDEAETLATQAISAEELVHFFSCLGQKVMPDFDPDTSTSDDVMFGAIVPLCAQGPSIGEHPVKVEVLGVKGLDQPVALVFRVLHLGQLRRGERHCISEQCSPAVQAASDNFCGAKVMANIAGLLPEHAVAFTVENESGSNLGVAWLSWAEVLQQDGWNGELPLHNTGNGGMRGGSWVAPSEAGPVRATDIQASHRRAAGNGVRLDLARLAVKIQVPEGYAKAVAAHAAWDRRSREPHHESEFVQLHSIVHEKLLRKHAAVSEVSATKGAFCKGCLHEESLPPEKMVVHSRTGRFVHLVTSVLADAIGKEGVYKVVEAKILEQDFHGVLDMLREAECQGTRYWIEMFAVDPLEHRKQGNEGGSNWHEGFLSLWPTVLRTMRQASCRKAVADIEARKRIKSPGPLTQLLVLDRDFHFLHEMGCLAELMLAKTMHLRQRLVLHPCHLKDGSLGKELKCLAEELGAAYNSKELLYTAPYLENRQQVYDAVKDLVIASVSEEKKVDRESVLQDMSLTDVATTIGMVRAQRSQPQDLEAADLDVDADA